jgi:hypothetical protein
MSTRELRATLNPPRELWFPPEPPPGSEALLIGWVRDVAPADEGVPDDVMRIVARALTRDYRLTFIDPGVEKSPQWKDSANGLRQTRFLKPTQFSPTAGYGLTTTCDPEVAVRLFSTDEWLWHLQSQWVFLSRPSDPPPEISFLTLNQVAQWRRLDPQRLQTEFGCQGVMAPGPDGEFIEIVLWQPGARTALLKSLQAEAGQAQVSWKEVPEVEFRETQWLPSDVRS